MEHISKKEPSAQRYVSIVCLLLLLFIFVYFVFFSCFFVSLFLCLKKQSINKTQNNGLG